MEKGRFWGQGPTYEIRKKLTLKKIIHAAIETGCIKKSNKKLKSILDWIDNEENDSTSSDELEAKFESEVEKLLNEGDLTPPAGNSNPSQRVVTSYQFARDPKVTAHVLLKAKGICQDCKQPAPFISKKNNRPFLEVHHIITMKDGGSDTVENAIALCPNCHRKRHYG
jgi:5-methylcytosine-specific restriction endonuclease McrA